MHKAFKEQIVLYGINNTYIQSIDNQAINRAAPGQTPDFSLPGPPDYIPENKKVTAKAKFIDCVQLELKAFLNLRSKNTIFF
jgi:hypothetical protein